MVWDVEVGDDEGVALDDGGDRAQQCRRAVGVCSVSTACYQCERGSNVTTPGEQVPR